MLSWEEIIMKLNGYVDEYGDMHPPVDINEYRIDKIRELSEKTGRNVITYYSGFLQGKEANVDVNDTDITGFVNAIEGLDREKGVDLIIHSPGGDPDAAEGIVKYLHMIFGTDVRVIIPQCAFSAGTMISCSAKTILLDESACIGPIDPQYGGIPVSDMIEEMNCAKRDIKKDPANLTFWQMRLERYPAGFYFRLRDAMNLTKALVTEWLVKYMFADENPLVATAKASAIVKKLNANNHSHGRHFNYLDCKELGLNAELLGDLKSEVMDLHNIYMISMKYTHLSKAIENQNGRMYITNEQEE